MQSIIHIHIHSHDVRFSMRQANKLETEAMYRWIERNDETKIRECDRERAKQTNLDFVKVYVHTLLCVVYDLFSSSFSIAHFMIAADLLS